MEQILIFPECEVFQETPIESHRKYWQDDDIWGIIESYPPAIRKGFEKLKEAIHEYIANGYSYRIQGKYRYDEKFLRKFCSYIYETECLEKSFARAGGIVYEFGLEWGKLKILQYYRKYQKNPPSETGFFYYFKRDCKQGALKQYGISCWGDLLEISLQDHTFFQRDRQNLTGHMGLKRAKAYLQKQYKMNRKIPMSCESGSKLIANAIRRDYWKEFGITTWGDLIFEVFGYIKGTMNLWKGSGGLDRALSWIKGFVNEHGKLPYKNSAHYYTINGLANNKFWMKYGINTWDDLTLKACGIVDSKKRRNSWTGIKGLERAKNELKKYFNDHQKLPTSSVFPNIVRVIIKGYWKEQNISSWNDLLRVTFGKVNVIHKTWNGQEGIKRAKKTLREYKMKYKKYPKNNYLFQGIKRSLNGNYWAEFGIFTWEDLIQHVFHEYHNNI